METRVGDGRMAGAAAGATVCETVVGAAAGGKAGAGESGAGKETADRAGAGETVPAGQEPAALPAHFKEIFHLHAVDAAAYSPLALAYIGDAVYEVMIRTRVVNLGNMQVNKMHRHDANLVKAETQARMIRLLEPELTEEEDAVYRRGRNAKSASGAKNASVIDYRTATGFEALVGYLYLTERLDRLAQLVGLGLEKIGEFDGE